MSSTKSYSKESRSYYSRSSSYGDNGSNSSYRSRPLSSRLIERDFSSPSSLTFDRFDDPFFFERRSRRFLDDFDRRLRWRFNDDLFDDEFSKYNFGNNSLDFGRNIPINSRGYNSSSSITRNIPVQYTPSSTNRRENVYRKNDDDGGNWRSSSYERSDETFRRRENRISNDDWPPKQETPTRKRTSMTIFVQPPQGQNSDGSHHQRTISTPSYPPPNRTNYY